MIKAVQPNNRIMPLVAADVDNHLVEANCKSMKQMFHKNLRWRTGMLPGLSSPAMKSIPAPSKGTQGTQYTFCCATQQRPTLSGLGSTFTKSFTQTSSIGQAVPLSKMMPGMISRWSFAQRLDGRQGRVGLFSSAEASQRADSGLGAGLGLGASSATGKFRGCS